jgi:nitrite reductase/ring-hydroxylating ferredoxin subunit
MKRFKLAENIDALTRIIPSGEKKLVRAGALSVCLLHEANGGWVAFEEACPHMGQSLTQGFINSQNEIVCPWHAYRYHLKTGNCHQSQGGKLRLFKVAVEQEGVFLEV